jgi:four helix bundle protein
MRGGTMRYEEWLANVSDEFTQDPLWRIEVYRFAMYAGDLAWEDASVLVKDRRTFSLADQLYRTVCSISANIAEGYSRRSSKDQARLYEYALGSAREARVRYYQGRYVLTLRVVRHRYALLTKIIKQLLTIIPERRSNQVRESGDDYDVEPLDITKDVPSA